MAPAYESSLSREKRQTTGHAHDIGKEMENRREPGQEGLHRHAGGSWKAGEGDSIVWSETKASAPSHYTELPNHFLTAHLPFNLSVVVSQALTRGRMIRFLYFTPLPRFRESAFQGRRHRRCGFNPWAGKIPWKRKWSPASVFLPGKILWTKEPGGLQSTGSQKNWTGLNTHSILQTY